MNYIRHKALAYIGVYELADLGSFLEESEALEALNNYIDEETERLRAEDWSDKDLEENAETFWASSRIERVK